jgi:predicted AlkP superfamily pyrophosphatase or phosphodiesterase
MLFRSLAARLALSAVLFSSLSPAQTRPAPRSTPAPGRPAEVRMPKLVVGLMVDQFRYDYLNRFRKEFTGGFARFLKQGAVFTNAHYEHFPTVTAIGHSTFMSGATPSVSGIIGNSWWDKETQKTVTSVLDDKTDLVGALGAGSSPRRLLVSTIPDELKISGKGGKAFGISIKDRSAILPAGHMANGAFWFDAQSGTFVSSTYYGEKLPAWVAAYNDEKFADKYISTEWMTLADPTKAFKKPVRSPGAKYAELDYTPYANELVEGLAERAIDAEKLGQGDKTDFLSVSFSANDYVGHAMGPDSDEVHDISILTDRLIEKFIQHLDKKVGLANVVIVMSADHGVAPLVEVNQARHMPGKRIVAADQNKALDEALTAKFGKGKWITNRAEYGITLNRELLASKKLEIATVAEYAADVLRGFEGIQRVFTHDQLLRGQVPHDRFHNRVINGFFPQRAADIYVVQYPYFLYDKTGTTHGLPFNYDTHVPVMFLGMGIRPGQYHQQIAVNDIAPTLATMLGIEIPSGAYGRVLDEILSPASTR